MENSHLFLYLAFLCSKQTHWNHSNSMLIIYHQLTYTIICVNSSNLKQNKHNKRTKHSNKAPRNKTQQTYIVF